MGELGMEGVGISQFDKGRAFLSVCKRTDCACANHEHDLFNPTERFV